MNKELKEKWEMACHNLMCYSSNYTMISPKKGFEKEWNQVKEEINVLRLEIEESGQGSIFVEGK